MCLCFTKKGLIGKFFKRLNKCVPMHKSEHKVKVLLCSFVFLCSMEVTKGQYLLKI